MSIPAPQRWHELSVYLDQALDLPPAERVAWLAALRHSNPELAEEVESLLADHEQAEQQKFLDVPPPLPLLAAGGRIGAYRLVKPIGEGGMGTVWLAERDDGRFQRQAAIKFLNVSLAPRSRERFQREGSILARLAHPRIAQLLDAGVASGGQPYLVLEYIEGEPIDQYCDRRALPLEARLRLFLDVLSAVSYAHANLIVHRDLKPSNVMVDCDGNVKLLDFGIAKLLDSDTAGDSTLTREAGAALTPHYAAPEQLCGDVVTTATDVYALGVVLYVLLSGTHPLGSATLSTADLVKRIVETEPPRLSDAVLRGEDGPAKAAARSTPTDKLARTLRGDLEIIVAKALKKNRSERYASVAALADDLQRYLDRKPIIAHADSLAYRASRFIRRNRTATALAVLALAAILGGSITTLIQARNARAQRDFALRELSRAAAFDDLNWFVLNDAAPSGKAFTVDDLLRRAEHIVERQHTDPLTRVNLIVSIGRQYTGHGDYRDARALLEKGYQEAQSLSDISTRAEAACDLAQALANTGDLTRAEALFQEGLSLLADRSPYFLERENCYLRGAEIAHNRAHGDQEVARAEAARREMERAPIHSDLDETSMLVSLASAYSDAGRLEDATRAFQSAAAKYTEEGRGDTEHAATLYNNWGVALTLLGRPLDAEKLFRRMLEIDRVNGSEDAVPPMGLLNYGRSLKQLGRLPEAAGYVARSLAKARADGSRVVLDQGLLLQAEIFSSQGAFSAAAGDLQQVKPDVDRLPPGHIAHASLASLEAILAAARSQRETALAFAGDAVQIADAAARRGYPRYYLQLALTRRAGVELQLGRLADAIADATRATTSIPDPQVRSQTTGDAYLLLGRACRQNGQAADALAAFRSALAIYQDALGPDHPSTAEARRLAGEPLAAK